MHNLDTSLHLIRDGRGAVPVSIHSKQIDDENSPGALLHNLTSIHSSLNSSCTSTYELYDVFLIVILFNR